MHPGWDTGTVEILSDIRFEPTAGNDTNLPSQKLKIFTSDADFKISSKDARVEGNAVVWSLEEPLRVPAYDRYASALVFELGSSSGVLGIGGGADAVATLWLQELLDDEEQEIKIPVITGKNLNRLRQHGQSASVVIMRLS